MLSGCPTCIESPPLTPIQIGRLLRMTSQAVCLPGARAHDNQGNSAHKRNRTQDRGNRNCTLLLVRDLNGPQINVFFLMGERHSADRKADDADDDEDDAYNSSGFHWAFLVPRRFCAQLPGCCCTRPSLGCGAIEPPRLATFRLGCQTRVAGRFAAILTPKYEHPEPWMQALDTLMLG